MKHRQKQADLLPPGLDGQKERDLFWLGFLSATIAAFGFFSYEYQAARQNCSVFSYAEKRTVWQAGAKMPSFPELIRQASAGMSFFYLLLCAMLLGMILYHYFFYSQGAHSLYTLRRLPDRMEWHRRALALPLLRLIPVLLSIPLVKWICYLFYLLTIPKEHLPPQLAAAIWRSILCWNFLM